MATTYSPGFPVPSALLSLTSLFEMGRGEPQCNNHHKLSLSLYFPSEQRITNIIEKKYNNNL